MCIFLTHKLLTALEKMEDFYLDRSLCKLRDFNCKFIDMLNKNISLKVMWQIFFPPPSPNEALLGCLKVTHVPWTEEPGGLQSKGSQGVGHD